MSCERGELDLADFRHLFEQYYHYSSGFTRLIGAALVRCDDDYYRARLSQNLWEEAGGRDVAERHTELFRQFLLRQLQVPSLEGIVFRRYARALLEQSLAFCLSSPPVEAAAFLAYGAEGIVRRLYSCFLVGLRAAGLPPEGLQFFTLHVECDDEHAETLKALVYSHRDQPEWGERCRQAAMEALDIRDEFFSAVHTDILLRRLGSTLEAVAQRPAARPGWRTGAQGLVSNVRREGPPLYRNTEAHGDVEFAVQRLGLGPDVLDPRVVRIPARRQNELHRHAHETLLLVLGGQGVVEIDGVAIPVQRDDVVHVPRWAAHRTRNAGAEELCLFAVTDYGLT
ncbi:MAG TPA: iron-containing redox enzyme family protein, partial [Methylomirabilota bacterium]|nr:iron-containing redox enzyme family protein [Methylomirabilota bacterium]